MSCPNLLFQTPEQLDIAHARIKSRIQNSGIPLRWLIVSIQWNVGAPRSGRSGQDPLSKQIDISLQGLLGQKIGSEVVSAGVELRGTAPLLGMIRYLHRGTWGLGFRKSAPWFPPKTRVVHLKSPRKKSRHLVGLCCPTGRQGCCAVRRFLTDP